ncbi:MAG: sigma-70 family RNA polymerase sigma factor [Bacteroidetes bacterium]|nr:sigma-70 family RNA polymerase sigma factor [Fibrella sp.]
MKTYTDEELVRLYVSTQRNEYFESLYSRYCDKVYRKCLSFSKDPARAEDYTHDIFLRLIVKLGSFREEAKFSTWLYSVTYNYCMDQMRSKSKVEVYADDVYEQAENYTDDNEAEMTEMEAQGLAKSLERLTPDEQSLLLMKYQDEFSIRDIAGMLDITESAVKMRLKRAKDKLRKRYVEGLAFWFILIAKVLSSLKWPFGE